MSMSVDTPVEPRNAPRAGAGAPAGPGHAAHVLIVPPKGFQPLDLPELWRFRELLYFLAWRDVKVRYKQTFLGAAWAVLQPLMMMIVFATFFGRLANVPTGGLPYPLFAIAGLLPWTFFSTAVSGAGMSVIGSERLITKIYFPRLAVPFAAVGASVVDFVVSIGLLFVMMAYYRVAPGPGLLLLPVIFTSILLTALGVGTLLAALNVAYRDFRYVIPFLLQIWMFATPSVYMQVDAPPPAAAAPAADGAQAGAAPAGGSDGRAADAPAKKGPGRKWLRAVLALNPMTGLISAFRAAALGGPIPWGPFAVSTACAGAAFLVGCLYFRRVEDGFADII